LVLFCCSLEYVLGLWLSLYEKNIILHNKFVVRRKTEYFCLYAVHKSAIGNAANLHLLWYQNKKKDLHQEMNACFLCYTPLHNCNNRESDIFCFCGIKHFQFHLLFLNGTCVSAIPNSLKILSLRNDISYRVVCMPNIISLEL